MKALKGSRNVTELRSFLGHYYDFRRLVQNYANIASPLNNKLRKDQSYHFELIEKKLVAMKSDQQKLISLPVLVLL